MIKTENCQRTDFVTCSAVLQYSTKV